MNNILVDTNILVYAFDQSSSYHNKAIELLKNEDINLFISTKNVSEFFAVCSKLHLDFDKTFGFYQDIKENIVILKPSVQSLSHFDSLLEKYKPKGNLVYDIEIVSIMMANALNTIATVNIRDFKDISEVTIVEMT